MTLEAIFKSDQKCMCSVMLTEVVNSGARSSYECSCKAQAFLQGSYRYPFGSDGQCRALRRLFRSLCLAAALPDLALGFPVPSLVSMPCALQLPRMSLARPHCLMWQQSCPRKRLIPACLPVPTMLR